MELKISKIEPIRFITYPNTAEDINIAIIENIFYIVVEGVISP
jgi:hypothetical protein